MSDLGIDYAADHAEMETDRGVSVKLRGRTVSALVSIPERFREHQDDGSFYRGAMLRVSIRTALIPSYGSTPIAEGETIEYDGDEYTVSNTTHDSDAGLVLLQCEGVAG